MKKLLAIGVLTLASLCLTAGRSSADSFGCFTVTSCWPFNILPSNYCCCGGNCFSCCHKCDGTVCFKPYNAFSTVCNPCCNPYGGGNPQFGMEYGTLPAAGGCGAEAAPMPAPVNTSFQYQNPVGYYGNMPVGYHYPTYGAPALYAQPMAAPYYWNSNGR